MRHTNEITINIRQELFAYRNGIIAEQLRRANDPHSIIMGCLLPDIVQIANQFAPSVEVAQELWSDKKHRECRLIATMLFPVESFDEITALAWANDVESTEVADILCLKLLRLTPFAHTLWLSLLKSGSELVRYTGLRLLMNLMNMGSIHPTPQLKSQLQGIAATGIMKPVMAQLLDEWDAIKSTD